MAKSDRRTDILDAALRCFSRQGYASTTIDEIRGEAGASTGSLYHHFEGKESIAIALYLDRLSAYEAGFAAVLSSTANAEQGIRAVVAHHLAWAEDHADDARFLLGHADLEHHLARARELPPENQRFYPLVQEWTQARVAEEKIRRLPPDLFYALWLGPAQELTRQWLAGRSRTKPTAATDLLATVAWTSLKCS